MTKYFFILILLLELRIHRQISKKYAKGKNIVIIISYTLLTKQIFDNQRRCSTKMSKI